MKELLIHIGIHKTGTTWLQRELFTSSNNVFEPLSKKSSGQGKLGFKFVIGEDGYLLSPYDRNLGNIKEELLNILKAKKHIKEKLFVLSSERLSGNPHSSGFDSKAIAERLSCVFPKAKILIVIREQKSFLLSNYFQYLSRGGVNNIYRYLNLKYDHKSPFFSPNHINYLPIIKTYQSLFGKENVLVLPYEMFKNSPLTFINSIGSFVNKSIEIDESRFNIYHNKKIKHFVMYHFRFLNYFIFFNSLNNYSIHYNKHANVLARGLRKILMKITPESWNRQVISIFRQYIDEWVSDRYQSSNQEVSQIIGIDLSQYGYHDPVVKSVEKELA